MFKVGIGQDSHRFLEMKTEKPFVIGGISFPDIVGMDADSDGDVVLHALCNAITSITHVSILGEVAPKLCHEQGITCSKVYLEKALETLRSDYAITHISFTVEGKRPRMQPITEEIRESVASLCGIDSRDVGFTSTSGDGLTSFAQGVGLQCFCILTVQKT